MKKILIPILFTLIISNETYAQFSDLKKALKEAKSEKDTPKVSAEELIKISPEPQQVQAKNFFEKYGKIGHSLISASYNKEELALNTESKPVFENCASIFPEDSKDETDASGNITKFLLNYKKSFEKSCYLFEVIHPTGAYAFGSEKLSEKYVDGTNRVYSKLVMFFDDFILIGMGRDKGEYYIKGDFEIIAPKAILKQISKSFTNKSFKEKVNLELQKYYDQMQVLLKGGDKKMEEGKRSKFGIKGKEVVSLAIEPFEYNKLFQGQVFNFDIIATLKDGTKLSTRQGFKDEYDIQVEGLELIKHSNVDGSTSSWYEIAKMYVPKNDRIRIVVKSKFHSTVKPVELTQNLDYENCEWALNDNGDQFTTHLKPAGSFRLEVKSAIDTNTKKECYEYKVWNKGAIVAHFKQVKTKPIVVNAIGGKGAKPNFGNQNGGNGGSITLVRDLSAKDCKISYNVNGGIGFSSINSNGANGTYTEIDQKLTW